MFSKLYNKIVESIIENSVRRPYAMLGLMLVLTIPSIYLISYLKIDTDLIRLLPDSNRSSLNTRELQDKVGDGGHFIAFLESNDREKLVSAAEYCAAEFEKFQEIESVQLKFPSKFIDKFGYTLVPTEYLDRLYDSVLSWEALVNPFVDDLSDDAAEVKKTHGDIEDEQDMEVMLRQYMDKPKYFENKEATIIGILLPTKHGVMNIGKIKDLYEKIDEVNSQAESKYGVWSGIGGNHRNKINELDTISNDLSQSGIVAGVLIIILLLIGFRSVSPLLAVVFPLIIGLLWGFAIVPFVIGPLNLITSFLILIMFGMGIDYSIHLVKRFMNEIQEKSIEDALLETYKSTGGAVLISGLTTALALSILSISGFRGFSEFGMISAISIISILLAMFLVLPPQLVVMRRFRLLNKSKKKSKKAFILNPKYSIAIAAAFVAIAVYSIFGLGFDYNLSNIDFDKNEQGDYQQVKEKHKQVYSMSMSPAAIYLSKGIESLDELNEVFKSEKAADSSMIGRVRSIRDYSPNEEESEERLELIDDIREALEGNWVNKIEDSSAVNLIEKFLAWDSPGATASIDELPDVLKRNTMGRENEDYFLLTLYPKEERKDGRNAMAFTENLYDIDLPENVRGPIGETVVFAELLWLVLGEGLWIALATLVGVFLLVYISTRSLKETLIMLIPLLLGLGSTLGIMAIIGLKVSFFNIIVIPALLGMGVDGGVHYVRRWRESGMKVESVQRELFGPLSLATFTTMLGYSGMVFAHHSGIESIGVFACLGLILIWFTTLVILPGILKFIENRVTIR
jgi:uncharacterized protein